MDEQRLLAMNIASNIMTSYFVAKNSYCTVNSREPDDHEKEDILKRVLSVFENLSTSYLTDIEEIATSAK